jgi:hypothetical protein
MAVIGGERNFHRSCLRDSSVFENGFEGRLGYDNILAGPEEGHVDAAQDFGRAATQRDIFARHAVILCERIGQPEIRGMRITRGHGTAGIERAQSLGGRAVGIFVEVQVNGIF